MNSVSFHQNDVRALTSIIDTDLLVPGRSVIGLNLCFVNQKAFLVATDGKVMGIAQALECHWYPQNYSVLRFPLSCFSVLKKVKNQIRGKEDIWIVCDDQPTEKEQSKESELQTDGNDVVRVYLHYFLKSDVAKIYLDLDVNSDGVVDSIKYVMDKLSDKILELRKETQLEPVSYLMQMLDTISVVSKIYGGEHKYYVFPQNSIVGFCCPRPGTIIMGMPAIYNDWEMDDLWKNAPEELGIKKLIVSAATLFNKKTNEGTSNV
ncbi:MAG: hypothetical protein KatS3mg087_1062 [Patescibacteria group bacterium]|nr:MAG: hypothetical protein KatS3mg087_1062 [Patescibacteria group bacterium]